MTSRSDLPRLAASLAVLGTELEMKGFTVWDRLDGWESGPRPAPRLERDDAEVCSCHHTALSHWRDKGPCLFSTEVGGVFWACMCVGFQPRATVDPAADDRREEFRQANRAGEQAAEFRADLAILDNLVQRINRRLDMAVPPDVSELRNRRTGEFDPETATDALGAGFCPHCWSCGVRQVPLSAPEGKNKLRRYPDRCRPCGDFRREFGFDKPKEMVLGHAQIPARRYSPAEYEAIVAAERARLAPKKKGKGKKSKRAA